MNSNSTPFKKRNNPFADIGTSSISVEESKPVVKQKPVVATPKRVKYTATMELDLRKRIKIAAANENTQFSSIIELACQEYLERMGL